MSGGTPITVISSSECAADTLLPPTGVIVTGSGRVYRLYRADVGEDLTFVDPVDGALLVECRCFRDVSAARLWVEADIMLRAGIQ